MSNNIFKVKKELINIGNSKKSTKYCNSKKLCLLKKVLRNVIFFFTDLSKVNFFVLPEFFHTN